MKKIVIVTILALAAASLVMAGAQVEKTKPAESEAPKIAATQPAKDAIVLKLAHADSLDIYSSRKHAQCLAFANIVNSRSGGRLDVQVFGAGALGGEREYVEAIMSGAVQAGVASGVLGSFFPPAMLTDIPYLFPSGAVAWEVMDGPFGDKLSKMMLQQTGMRNLAFAEVGFRNFTNNTRPIRNPGDLKGLKIRVMETPLYVNMLKAMGALPTPIAWTETYTALQTGVVDGQENPVGTILFAKFPEVQKYITLDGHVYGVDWFLINEKFFQSLPEDLKYILLDAAKISSGVGRGVQSLLAAGGIAQLQEKGMIVYSPTEQELEQFKKATQPAVIEWLKTKVDPALIQEILAEVDRVVARHKQQLK